MPQDPLDPCALLCSQRDRPAIVGRHQPENLHGRRRFEQSRAGLPQRFRHRTAPAEEPSRAHHMDDRQRRRRLLELNHPADPPVQTCPEHPPARAGLDTVFDKFGLGFRTEIVPDPLRDRLQPCPHRGPSPCRKWVNQINHFAAWWYFDTLEGITLMAGKGPMTLS
jgi:hypothetical protein